MKNFKKIIILSITILFIIIYLIHDYFSNNITEIVEENIFVEEGNEISQTNTIFLHITGEVNLPRHYSNRRGSKIS